MSASLSVNEALRLIPGIDVARLSIEKLSGGLTNRSFRLTENSTDIVLRLESEQSRLFRFDRKRELEIHRKASAAGIAPPVIFADPGVGILVTEFVPGDVWCAQHMCSKPGIEALADILRRVHAIGDVGTPVDLTESARAYEERISGSQDWRAFASHCVDVVEAVGPATISVCCHNDVVAGNLIDKTAPCLIDWEFASQNEPMFDLASAVCYHDFADREVDALLRAYSGSVPGELRDRLETQMRVYDAVQWLWIACRHLVDAQPWQAERLAQIQSRLG